MTITFGRVDGGGIRETSAVAVEITASVLLEIVKVKVVSPSVPLTTASAVPPPFTALPVFPPFGKLTALSAVIW